MRGGPRHTAHSLDLSYAASAALYVCYCISLGLSALSDSSVSEVLVYFLHLGGRNENWLVYLTMYNTAELM